MANERDSKRYESVFTKKVRAGKRRTYYFDVRRTKGDDYYLTVTESSRRLDGGYDRHKIFVYKEDFNRFARTLEETLSLVKNELMPYYDYDEFEKRQDAYEQRLEQSKKNKADEAFLDEDEDMSW